MYIFNELSVVLFNFRLINVSKYLAKPYYERADLKCKSERMGWFSLCNVIKGCNFGADTFVSILSNNFF